MSFQPESPVVLYVPISNRDDEFFDAEDSEFIDNEDDIRPSSARNFWMKKQNHPGDDHMKQYRNELEKCNAKYEQLARNYDKLQSKYKGLHDFRLAKSAQMLEERWNR